MDHIVNLEELILKYFQSNSGWISFRNLRLCLEKEMGLNISVLELYSAINNIKKLGFIESQRLIQCYFRLKEQDD
jgi:hypothetical protein